MEFCLNYSPGPVTTAMHLDIHSRAKLVLGPFGCLSCDTEYLTPSGWKRLDEYSDGDDVAEFNLNTKAIEFHKSAYIKLPCDSFNHLKNKYGIDQLLSDEHTVLYNTRFKPDEWRTIKASDLAEVHNSLGDGFSGRIPTVFKAPETEGVDMTDDELRIMVAVSADGSFSRNSSTTRCYVGLRKERKKERLRMLLTKSGIDWIESNSPSRPTETNFRFNAPERNKDLSNYYRATYEQFLIIADEFVHWDGHVDEYGGKIFSSCEKKNADLIQYALTVTGMRSTIAEVQPKNENCRINYRVYGNTGATDLSLRQAPKIVKVPSRDGFKYCFNTSTGFFVARRNGRIFITGNSGKTSAGCMELVDFAAERVKPINGIKRTRFAVVRNCYDDKTEILTENGWKFFKDLSQTDAVATLQNGKTVFEVPSYHYAKTYEGEMIKISSDNLDLCVTPDHRLYAIKKYGRKEIWGEPKFVQAKDAYKNESYKFLTTAGYDGQPNRLSNDLMEFLGFWFAEGNADIYDGRHHLIVTQCVRTEYADDVCTRTGMKFAKNRRTGGGFNYRFAVTEETKILIRLLRQCGKSTTKRIPKWISECSAEQARLFLTGFIMGDGHFREDKHETTCAWTSSEGLADDLQAMALKAGWTAIKRVKKISRGNGKECSVTFLQPIQQKPQAKKNHWSKIQYSGMVYCVEVSSHIIFVRRDGKPVWCGQTFPELSQTTIKTFLDWFPPSVFGKYNEVKHTYDIKFENKEIEIVFKALDSPQDVRDLLSLEITGAWIDEAREIHEDVFLGLLGRIPRYPSLRHVPEAERKDFFIGTPQILLTTNYPSTEHWLYKKFVETPVDGYSIFYAQQDENKHNLPDGYYDKLEKDYADRPDLLKTLVRGEWGVTVRGKLVVPEFNRKLHVATKPLQPVLGTVYRGWDNTGLSPACVITQLSPTGQWLILKEFCGEDIGITEFTEAVNIYCNQKFGESREYVDYGDPAGRNRGNDKVSPAMLMAKLGVRVQNGIQTFKVRREAFAGRCTKLINGQPALLIDPSCTRLIDGLEGGYHYPMIGATGIYSTEPKKNEYSHICESGEYLASRLFPIKEPANPAAALKALDRPPSGGGGAFAY